MNKQNPYFRPVELLVKVLPIVGQSDCFALKGGTAINLFYREMPRLSVDIDLVYLPLRSRDEALQEMTQELFRIAREIERIIPLAKVQYSKLNRTEHITRLLVELDRAVIKVELSPVLRGTVYPAGIRRICRSAEERFGFAEVQVVSFEDLYAGKILAALDRQHPRDLFGVEGYFPCVSDFPQQKVPGDT